MKYCYFLVLEFCFKVCLCQNGDFMLIQPDSALFIDIKYATKNNFTNKIIYDCGQCWLKKPAASAIMKAKTMASKRGLKLILYDCYRPSMYQWRLWEAKPDPNYVMHPRKGSVHSRGGAVDIGLADAQGQALDLGTDYDSFSEKSHRNAKGLKANQMKNRKLLDTIMMTSGFKGIRTEWWHFDFAGSFGWKLYNWKWTCIVSNKKVNK